jgi:hypothetical protein
MLYVTSSLIYMCAGKETPSFFVLDLVLTCVDMRNRSWYANDIALGGFVASRI